MPATTAILSNNQIGKYISRKNATILKKVFSATANGFGKAFYQPNEFTVLQDSYAFKFKDDSIEIEKVKQFILSSLNRVYSKYNWGYKSGWNKIKEEYIQLPIKNKNIDFEFMEKIDAELEAQRIAELEAYLKVTGLKDYNLTEYDKKILDKFNEMEKTLDRQTDRIDRFLLENLFISKTGDVDLQQSDINCKGTYFINSGLQNNGIKGKTDKIAKIFKKNTITVDFWGNAFYRNFEYKMATHNHVFSLSGDTIKNEKVGLYIVSTMRYLTKIYSYDYMGTWNKMKKMKIELPIENDKIDYKFMEDFIKVIEKLIIKDVVIWADKKIRLTKQLINR